MAKKKRKNSNYQKGASVISGDGVVFNRSGFVNVMALAIEDSNGIADAAFVELALQELREDIEYIERQHNVMLVGDRADFNSARRDLPGKSKGQVVHFVSVWRSGIFARYAHR